MSDTATVHIAGEAVDLDGLASDIRQAFLALSHDDREGVARRDLAAEARLFEHLTRIRSGQPNREARRRARKVTRRGMSR